MPKVYIASSPWVETSGKDVYRRVVLVPWSVGKLAVLDELYSPSSGPSDKESISVTNGDYFHMSGDRFLPDGLHPDSKWGDAYECWERRSRENVFLDTVSRTFAALDIITKANAAASA